MKKNQLVCVLVMFGLLLFASNSSLATPDTSKANTDDQYFASFAKTHAAPTENVQDPAGSQQSDAKQKLEFLQDRLCIALLVFALLLSSLEIWLFLKSKIDSVQIVKLLTITLIIFSLLFLICAGFDNTQTQTSVGLLGTIAGYLLGKSASDDAHRQKAAIATEAQKNKP
jgi:hypothetical protein